MTQTVRRFDYTDVGRNIARGILPVASNFDVDPSSLANATNGNIASPTGIGYTVTGGAATTGDIALDLGEVKTGILLPFLKSWSSASLWYLYVYVDDVPMWSRSYTGMAVVAEPGQIRPVPPIAFHGRVIKLHGYAAAIGTHYMKIYEIIVLEVLS